MKVDRKSRKQTTVIWGFEKVLLAVCHFDRRKKAMNRTKGRIHILYVAAILLPDENRLQQPKQHAPNFLHCCHAAKVHAE